ncbi:hypothetical protein I4U23_008775 [Adineta vaga]|nr:hypothetical protein I4U23_008775 [Adineta vaga]
MMPVTTFVKPTTPVSTVSSAGGTTTTAVQSGPYTKAQFLNTMEGSRSVKNIKEIEQLLRDYPAALELYRTKKYKVKVKYEADVERVILVEKRSNTQHARSRTQSKERNVPTTTSTTEVNDVVQKTTNDSSNQAIANVQLKVDQNQRSSKERDLLTTSQSKQDQNCVNHCDRSHDSRSIVSHSKHKGKKHSRDYPTALVPYVPNANPAANMWQQSRALQPYYNHALYQPQHQQYQSQYYMPPALMPPQNPMYQQPYYHPHQGPYPIAYQQQHHYPSTIQSKSAGNTVNPTLRSPRNYQSTSQNPYPQNQGANLPQTFHTFHPAQQYYQNPPAALYPSQVPYQMPFGWLPGNNMPNSKPHGVPPVSNYTQAPYPQQQQQQQKYPAGPVIEQNHYHHHRHHTHRSHPTDTQMHNTAIPVEVVKQHSIPQTSVSAAINNENSGEKLTIRQLNEIFVQMDPSGRLTYQAVPTVLQRFGMNIVENDLVSAAQDLKYNVGEPISARRLVHVLVKLGKIAKSTNQPRPQPHVPLGSPPMLPEDREVTDILAQRRATAVQSTHIHSSAYPNYWY